MNPELEKQIQSLTSRIEKLLLDLSNPLNQYKDLPIRFWHNRETSLKKKSLVSNFLVQANRFQRIDKLSDYITEVNLFIKEFKKLIAENKNLQKKKKNSGRLGEVLDFHEKEITEINNQFANIVRFCKQDLQDKIDWLKVRLQEAQVGSRIVEAKKNHTDCAYFKTDVLYKEFLSILHNVDKRLASSDVAYFEKQMNYLNSCQDDGGRQQHLEHEIQSLQAEYIILDWQLLTNSDSSENNLETLLLRHNMRQLHDDLMMLEKTFFMMTVVSMESEYRLGQEKDLFDEYGDWVRNIIKQTDVSINVSRTLKTALKADDISLETIDEILDPVMGDFEPEREKLKSRENFTDVKKEILGKLYKRKSSEWITILENLLKVYRDVTYEEFKKYTLNNNRLFSDWILPELFLKIAPAIFNRAIVSLDLSSDTMSDESIIAIAKLLKYTNIRKFSISNENMYEENRGALFRALEFRVLLDAGKNRMPIEWVEYNQRVQDLSRLPAVAAQKIRAALIDSTITILDLANCNLDDNAINIIGKLLQHTGVTSLNLTNNKISGEGLSIFNKKNALVELNLSDNPITSKSVEKSIFDFNLQARLISNSGDKEIVNMLLQRKKLASMDPRTAKEVPSLFKLSMFAALKTPRIKKLIEATVPKDVYEKVPSEFKFK